jgi:tetratricopeptide (TPR) repeat protein
LPLASHAREIVVAKLGAKHEAAFVLQVQRARALGMLGQLDEAQRLLREVVQGYALTGYSTTNSPLYYLGVVTRLAGEPAQAERIQRESLAKLRPGPRARRSSARNLVELGLDRLEQGDYAAARSSLEEAFGIYREKFRTPPPEHTDALIGIGRVALAEQQAAAALSPLLEADRYWRELDPTNRWGGEAAFWLGRCYLALGRTGEAREALARAENILAQSPIPMDRKLLTVARASQSGS